eukprot:7137010-Pyramimonas_sp.AAC.1
MAKLGGQGETQQLKEPQSLLDEAQGPHQPRQEGPDGGRSARLGSTGAERPREGLRALAAGAASGGPSTRRRLAAE